MTLFTRRNAMQLGAGALAGTTMLASGSLRAQIAVKDVAPPNFPIEDGASLRVLRPSKFVAGRRDAVSRELEEVHREDRRRGHGHQRELGGPAAEDGDRGCHR